MSRGYFVDITGRSKAYGNNLELVNLGLDVTLLISTLRSHCHTPTFKCKILGFSRSNRRIVYKSNVQSKVGV